MSPSPAVLVLCWAEECILPHLAWKKGPVFFPTYQGHGRATNQNENFNEIFATAK